MPRRLGSDASVASASVLRQHFCLTFSRRRIGMVLRASGRFPIHIGLCRCGKRRGHPGACYENEVQHTYTLGNPAPQPRETVMDQQQQARAEALGPAETIINTLTNFSDHMVHSRPGVVMPDNRTRTGVRWIPVIWKEEDGTKVVYHTQKIGRRRTKTRIGTLNGTNEVKDGARVVGEYRQPRKFPVFPEVAAYFYRQIAEVWRMDNEFAAKWASYAFPLEHRDLKVVLCAFMLVQTRMGEPVVEDGEILFHDDDYRNVGEAMALIKRDDKKDLNPKLLLRVGDVLRLPQVAEINRELGFGKSARNPAMGRYPKVVEKWLRYREENVQMLEGLVRAGFRTTVMRLARMIGYKPTSAKFFEILRWKQVQADDGRREIAIGAKVEKAESWEGWTEKEICEFIVTPPSYSWKRICGLLATSEVGMTRAVVASSIEAGSMSDQDLIILTPTLEELGLLKVKSVEKKWKAALDAAENQRAANIARNVRSQETKEALEDAQDKATAKALEKATKDLRVYVIVDKSGSMTDALDEAQEYLTKFLAGFPLDRLHVSVFNTYGQELQIKAPKAAAVRQAFAGHRAGGGTAYAQGVLCLAHHKPEPGEDALMIFVGDEEEYRHRGLVHAVQQSGINPVAFGLLKVQGARWGHGNGSVVRNAAADLGIPCFPVDTNMFDSDDPYAVTRLLSNLIEATPVGQPMAGRPAPRRKTLVQQILETKLLEKPVWA